MEKYLRISVQAKQLERLCNYYGSAIEDSLSAEYLDQGRDSDVYVMVDGSMALTREQSWKEVKLGRIFERNDLHLLHPKRNWIEKSNYVADIAGLRPFLDRMESAIPTQSNLVFIADGARWIWKWIESLYPDAIQILDFYHVMEYAASFATLQFKNKSQRSLWLDQVAQWLNEDQLDLLLEELQSIHLDSSEAKKSRDRLLSYYWNNYHRMQYQSFRQKKLLIGSGPIESAHRTVIQKRLKLSGQRWNIQNAQNMLNLRVTKESDKWEQVVNTIRRAA